MSQAGINSSTSAPSPPDVPTEFVTDDGTAVPAGNILNLTGIDSTENNDNGILTRANPNGSDNAFVVLTNRLQGETSTSGAVTANVISFTLDGTAGAYNFEVNVVSFASSVPAGGSYKVVGGVITDGATATVIGSNVSNEFESAALNASEIDVSSSGNDLLIQVTGVAGVDINWGAVGEYVRRQ